MSDPVYPLAHVASSLGMNATTLRMWRRRYGFPEVRAAAQGRRGIPHSQIELIRAVQRLQAGGMTIPAAIQTVLRHEHAKSLSVFAPLRTAHPELQPRVLAAAALQAILDAIADEYLAAAGGGFVFAKLSPPIDLRCWQRVARAAEVALRLPDFDRPGHSAATRPPGGPPPLVREQVLIIDTPVMRACVCAWAQPGRPQRAGEQRYETIWSAATDACRTARQVATDVIHQLAPGHCDAPLADANVLDGADELAAARRIVSRILLYLARAAEASTTTE